MFEGVIGSPGGRQVARALESAVRVASKWMFDLDDIGSPFGEDSAGDGDEA